MASAPTSTCHTCMCPCPCCVLTVLVLVRYNLAKRAELMIQNIFSGKQINLDLHFLPKKRALNGPNPPKQKQKKKKRRSKKSTSSMSVNPLLDSQVPLPPSLVGVGLDGDSTTTRFGYRFYRDPLHVAKKMDRDNIPDLIAADECGVPIQQDELYLGYMSPSTRATHDPTPTLLSQLQSPPPGTPPTPPTQVSPSLSPPVSPPSDVARHPANAGVSPHADFSNYPVCGAGAHQTAIPRYQLYPGPTRLRLRLRGGHDRTCRHE